MRPLDRGAVPGIHYGLSRHIFDTYARTVITRLPRAGAGRCYLVLDRRRPAGMLRGPLQSDERGRLARYPGYPAALTCTAFRSLAPAARRDPRGDGIVLWCIDLADVRRLR
jgi:hypothetical protein